ncbi:MAG: ATP-binding cassette domain-containing protein [Thermoleophilia bacterium]|nr:ATP-binding cassette domain-containing protein [Thermoleophilia bacterium]
MPTEVTVAADSTSGRVLLRACGITKRFPLRRRGLLRRPQGWVHAVEDVSIDVLEEETLGLVGESGCGKSTLGRILLRLVEPDAGTIEFDGQDVTRLEGNDLRRMRRNMQIVFQDPSSSLNPRHRVSAIIAAPLEIHGYGTRVERDTRVRELLEVVGLRPEHADRYPHEFSGGQRQRIGIARALALNPRLIVCDEPVSALDVSIQAQIVNLLGDLQEEFGLTYLFIAHDLAVVRQVSDRVAVMYLGRIVETGPALEVCDRPAHHYTNALLSAVPIPEIGVQARRNRIVLRGDVPSLANPPGGCPFHPRCHAATTTCATELPPLRPRTAGSNEHLVACHYPL